MPSLARHNGVVEHIRHRHGPHTAGHRGDVCRPHMGRLNLNFSGQRSVFQPMAPHINDSGTDFHPMLWKIGGVREAVEVK
jgi:hypothetical protein